MPSAWDQEDAGLTADTLNVQQQSDDVKLSAITGSLYLAVCSFVRITKTKYIDDSNDLLIYMLQVNMEFEIEMLFLSNRVNFFCLYRRFVC